MSKESPLWPTIAVLDDDPDRVAVMRACLQTRLPNHSPAFFDNAPQMIAWLAGHLNGLQLVSLDHDLGPDRVCGGRVLDPGTGRDVADYLATRNPACPVIIHTTNSLAAPGMERVLQEAGWTCTRVFPYNDVQWIGEMWIEAVLAALSEQ